MPGKKGGAQQISRGYDALLSSVIDLLETGRQIAARSVNAVLTMTRWQVGQRFGGARAGRGEEGGLWDRIAQAPVAGLAGAARSWFLGEKPGANTAVLPAVAISQMLSAKDNLRCKLSRCHLCPALTAEGKLDCEPK